MKCKMITEHAYEIRQQFQSKFLMNPAEFAEKYADLFDKYGDAFSYASGLMWDRMHDNGISEIHFGQALEYLSHMRAPVLLMSEGFEYPYCQGMTIDGKEHKGFIAQADPKELAELIEYEWITPIRLARQDMYMTTQVLPSDLYVFDPEMKHMLVFTHENEDWENDETDESRICLAYGFDSAEVVE